MVFYTTFEHSILLAYLQPKNRSEWSTLEVSQNGTISLFIARNFNFDGLESIDVWNNLTNWKNSPIIYFIFIHQFMSKQDGRMPDTLRVSRKKSLRVKQSELSTNIQVKALERLKKE